ncbi:MAG: HD domain-containing phosphohydrolase [Anaerolineae bacterium]
MADWNQAILRWLNDSANQGILITDAELNIRGWNKWLEVHSGRPATEMVGQNLLEMYPKLVERGLDRYYRNVLAGEVQVLAQRFHRYLLPMPAGADANGFSLMPQSAQIAPLIENGQVFGTITAIEDQTDRVVHEEELRRQLAVQRTLYEIDRAILTLDLSDCLQRVVNEAAALVGASTAAVVLREGDTLRIGASCGDDGRREGLHLEAGSIAAWVARSGQAVVLTDVESHDGPSEQKALYPGSRSIVAAPLVLGEQVIGVLLAESPRPAVFGGSELELMVALGTQAAIAIRNAQLHEQTEQRLERLSALRAVDFAITASLDLRVTLNILLDHAVSQLGVDAAAVLLFNPYTHSLEFLVGRGFRKGTRRRFSLRLGEGFAGHIVVDRRTLAIPDLRVPVDDLEPGQPSIEARRSKLQEEGFVAYFGAPLIAKGEVKGVLELLHRSPLRPDSEWFEFLKSLATQAAIAIDNADMFNNLQRSNQELRLAYNATIEGWARALELRDRATEGHSQRVTDMTLRLARAMGISREELVHVRRGALLHDIGKMAVPDAILRKVDELSNEEWDIIRQHPVHAYQMLSPIAFLRPALDIPYCHHERWDGGGYPRGLKGEQIPLPARIFAVVDVYDALCSDRPYRQAWPEEKALQHIREQAGHHFDPQVVELFFEHVVKG